MTPSTTLGSAAQADHDGTDPRRSGFFVVWFPWLLLVLALSGTVLLAFNAQKDAEVKSQAAFDHRASEILESVDERLRDYEQILRGVLGFVLASREIGLPEWRRYINALDYRHDFPGMYTIGYASLVSHERLPAFLARVRRDIVPDFQIFPPGDRPDYAPVIFSGSDASGKPARGFDLLVDPARRDAIQQAHDFGRPVVSGKLRLLDGEDPTGFLMLLPMIPPAGSGAVDEPVGMIIGVFRMGELIGGVLGHNLSDVSVRVYDGAAPAPDALMYEDVSIERKATGSYRPAFRASRTLLYHGHQWNFELASLPYPQAVAEIYKARAILGAGTVFSLLLFFIAFSLARIGKRAERIAETMTIAARTSEAKFRSYVERAPLGVLVADGQGRVVEMNQAAADLLGCDDAASAAAMRVLDLCTPEDRESAAATLRELARKGELEAEWRLIRSDGRVVWLLWRAVRFPDGRFLAFCQDVTQRRLDADALRESEARALSASRMKSEFLASMSHELRTPLTSIRGFSELMERRAPAPAFKEQAAIIRRAAEHLTALLNDILDMSKVEAGAMQIVPKPVSIRKIATDTVELFRSAADAKGLALNLAIGAEVPRAAMWDSLRVKQILNNLLSNAIKFTGRGWVRMDVNCIDNCVRFDVTDTGPGIAPEAQAAVFERFRQADDRVAHQYGGTGLGLALALSLARLMEGNLSLRSEPGRGCTFTLTLPVGLGSESATVELVSTDSQSVHATASHPLSAALSVTASQAVSAAPSVTASQAVSASSSVTASQAVSASPDAPASPAVQT